MMPEQSLDQLVSKTAALRISIDSKLVLPTEEVERQFEELRNNIAARCTPELADALILAETARQMDYTTLET